MDVAFVRLGPEDLPSLVMLEQLCFAVPWTEQQFQIGLTQRAFHVFGFKNLQELIGYISFYQIADEMEILNIAVHPNYRRKGLGRRLLGLALQICFNLGIKQAFLEVRPSNTPALALYRFFGFEQIGIRSHYYPNNGEDALIMKATLNSNLPTQGGVHEVY